MKIDLVFWKYWKRLRDSECPETTLRKWLHKRFMSPMAHKRQPTQLPLAFTLSYPEIFESFIIFLNFKLRICNIQFHSKLNKQQGGLESILQDIIKIYSRIAKRKNIRKDQRNVFQIENFLFFHILYIWVSEMGVNFLSSLISSLFYYFFI